MSAFYKNRKLLGITVFFAVSLAAFVGLINLYTGALGLELPKTIALKQENASLKSEMQMLSSRMNAVSDNLHGLGIRDEKVYRSIFGLKPRSGHEQSYRYACPADSAGTSVVPTAFGQNMRLRCDSLISASYSQTLSYDAIAGMLRNAADMTNCIPAICPVNLGDSRVHLGSPFGLRFHPILHYQRMHTGVDLGAPKGYPVYAPGDGVVEMEKVEMESYGRQIFINHGYGYSTRFAHLDVILLPEGVKVKRGEQIGMVGSTGLSTGPHLHYEVFYKGEHVNPVNYFDKDMPSSQYEDLVRSAAARSEKMLTVPGK